MVWGPVDEVVDGAGGGGEAVGGRRSVGGVVGGGRGALQPAVGRRRQAQVAQGRGQGVNGLEALGLGVEPSADILHLVICRHVGLHHFLFLLVGVQDLGHALFPDAVGDLVRVNPHGELLWKVLLDLGDVQATGVGCVGQDLIHLLPADPHASETRAFEWHLRIPMPFKLLLQALLHLFTKHIYSPPWEFVVEVRDDKVKGH